MQTINSGWYFRENWSEDFMSGKEKGEEIRIPHTVRMLGYHYIDEHDYQMISGYRKELIIDTDLKGKKIFIQFDGCAHIATVYLDGKEIGYHEGGYTAFRVDITPYVKKGSKHILAVKLDSTENSTIPPFGHVIDYLTYGGIYRDVWLDIVDEEYVEDIFVYTPELNEAVINTSLSAEKGQRRTVTILDEKDNKISEVETTSKEVTLSDLKVSPWHPDHPKMYKCRVQIEGHDECREVNFGFRTVNWDNESFYLNGEKFFFRGLNRHQSYPYIGYAASESLQREDARILKYELGCNAVRTSHYPQSQYFVDECDRIGLLVFTEIPGWQHVGDESWQKVAIEHTKEMVLQYRNHPSVFLWGVRINESQDYDDFYTQTNKAAHELDPSRATSGVRYIENSSLLEDVYAYNDFSHKGDNPGAKKKEKVTKENKPLFISESNGHMFPTKPYDHWEKRQEHALRHATVLNAAMEDGQHAGCFQWCMFDYTTHKDFGSGDRVCYHGVMDGWRNPKPAAYTYASQQDDTPVMEITSTMDIGDYPGGLIGKVYVLSNMDKVLLYKNGDFVTELKPAGYSAMKHPPLVVDDTIGKLLETREGFTGEKEKLLHDCLKTAAEYGYDNMPLPALIKMGYAMLKYHISYAEGADLYGRYVGNWGGESRNWRFDGIKDGKVVISKTVSQSCNLHLDVKVSSHTLYEGDSYDMASIRVRILDEFGNSAPYCQIPLTVKTEGNIEAVGPKTVTCEGGSTGIYVKTTGKAGKGRLYIYAEGFKEEVIDFAIEKR